MIHIFFKYISTLFEFSSTPSSTAQFSQIHFKSFKHRSTLSSTTQLSQVQFNSLQYHSTLSSRTHLSQVQLKYIKYRTNKSSMIQLHITYQGLSTQTTQCIWNTMLYILSFVPHMFNSFYVVSLFSFPDQLMAKCVARLPLRNHVL